MELPDTQDFELTIEDILNLHRQWITKLYVEDMKAVGEIVESLHERGFLVSRTQIQRCIRNWGLVQHNSTQEPQEVTNHDRESVVSPSPSIISNISSSGNTPCTLSDPDVVALYTFKPLPPIPGVRQILNSKVPLPSDVHDVRNSLDSIPRGLHLLEIYASTVGSHKGLAIGQQRDFVLPPFRRAGESREGWKASAPRVRNRTEKSKKTTKKEDSEKKKQKDKTDESSRK